MNSICSILFLGVIITAGATSHVDGGSSISHRSDDEHGNYAFKYDIVDKYGAANGREEVGDAYGNKRGFYTIADIDGRARRVDYVADELGFRVVVQTNEPGTASSKPADAVVASAYSGHELHVQPVLHEAPVAAAILPSAAVYSPHVNAVPRLSHATRLYSSPSVVRGTVSHSTRLYPTLEVVPVPARRILLSTDTANVRPISHSSIIFAKPKVVSVKPVSHVATVVNSPRVSHSIPLSLPIRRVAPVIQRVSLARAIHPY